MSEAKIVRQLRKKHKPYEVQQIIKSMISSGDLVEIKGNPATGKKYRVASGALQI